MGFTATLVSKRQLPGAGRVEEQYNWSSDGGTTTGTITCDTTQQPQIIKVTDFSPSSNGDTDVACATDAGPNKLKLTFTANDSGTVTIVGDAA